MAELSVKYMGLNLKNPIIAGSSGLTHSIVDLQRLEESGVAAVVMKSLFEEQIYLDADYQRQKASKSSLIYLQHSETFDYIDTHIRSEYVSDYVQTIREAKKKLHIPVIASINCVSASGWTSFAAKLQDAGVDAIELNVAVQPLNPALSAADVEQLHLDIIHKVCSIVSIPVAVKISQYFADLSRVIDNIAAMGVNGIVLFNRFFSPDININNMQVVAANIFSTPAELSNTLRWIALKSDSVPCDLCASTGVHSGRDVIKILLAGGAATQIVSTLYNNGLEQVVVMLNELETWMAGKGYNYIDQFAGKMNGFETDSPATYGRMQFMKYYSQVEKSVQ
ncbi:MAG: dihydroorotate dehydrogenase-like protein [Bacteroidales bacterium]|jgi:dihydroorotate dehydrogenase (fumarate)|nr:dihydroorotate dehydrogenase-like protein [Bacteroidales bacterium]